MSQELFSTTKAREDWNKYFKKNTGLIIDLGCGYGADSYFLAKSGYRVMAIDKNKNIKFKHPNLFFVQQELEIPIYEKFDGVIANFSLQFLPPEIRLGVMKYYLEHLKPGGIFYILTFKKFVTPAFLRLFPQKPEIEYCTKEDDHLPIGKHIHQIAKIVYQKPRRS